MERALVPWIGVIAALSGCGPGVRDPPRAEIHYANRGHFAPDDRTLVLSMVDRTLFSFDLRTHEFRQISSSIDGYDTWISPSGRYGAREITAEVRDFETGETSLAGEPGKTYLVGFVSSADDLLLFRPNESRWVRQSAGAAKLQPREASRSGSRLVP